MRTFARDDVNLAVCPPSWHVGLAVEAVGGASWAKGQALGMRLVDRAPPSTSIAAILPLRKSFAKRRSPLR